MQVAVAPAGLQDGPEIPVELPSTVKVNAPLGGTPPFHVIVADSWTVSDDAKVYTLSPASKDVVRELKDYVNVKAYVSDALPAELKSLSRYVRDLLDEYRSSSKGKFRFEAVDPGTDKKLEEEASSCGVRKLQIQKLEEIILERARDLRLCEP